MTSTTELRRISVVYITDTKYVMPTYISMLSLKSNLDEGCMAKVYVMCDEVPDASVEKFLSLKDERFLVDIINVKNAAHSKLAESCQSHVTSSALFKFSISEILEKEDKVIYLDGDTLVQGNLEELYKMNLEEKYVAAVDDQLDKIIDGQSCLAAQANICSEHYFNSGVMLLNIKKMREDDVYTALINYRINGKNYFMDQDTFNAILKDKRIILPYKYNFMSTCVEHYSVKEISDRFFDGHQSCIEDCIECAVIVHLTGTYKPWEYNIPWFSPLFLKYYEKSPYYEKKLKLKSVTKILRDIIEVSSKYIFPYEKIEKDEKIILYGAGRIGKMYHRQIMATDYCEIVGWVDSDFENKSSLVQSPEIIKNTSFSKILIGIASHDIAENVRTFLVEKYQIDTKNIIII